jgi:hypothetical protein
VARGNGVLAVMLVLFRSAKASVLAGLALLGVVGGGAAITHNVVAGGGSSSRAAEGPTLYVSPSGSDAGPCSKARPCQSFDAAYHRAVPAATVLVETGTYGAQTLTPDPAKGGGSCDGYTLGASLTSCITFQPDTGAKVSVTGEIQIFGDGVRLRNFSVSGVTVGDCNSSVATTNVVLQRITGVNLVINNASYVGDLDGNWGPLHGNQIVYVNDCAYIGTLKEATHVRFDGGIYHDAIQDAPGQHLECFHVEAADYVTIRNSTFRNCAQHDLALGGSAPSEPETHYLIENNVLARACSEQSAPCGANNPIDMTCLLGPHSDWTIRFNSMDGGAFFTNEGCAWTGTNLYYGNVETFPMKIDFFCKLWAQYGWTRSYTVGGAGGIPCGTGSRAGDVLTSPGPPAYDFRIKSLDAAVDLVPQALPTPRLDLDGHMRPPRWKSDAGALQWDPVLMVLGRSIGGITIGRPAADALAFYGRPRSRRTVRSGSKRLQRLSFRLHGGELWLLADRGVVVGVGTTSRYYVTASGLGVKGEAGVIRSASGTAWSDCARALHRRFGGADVYVGLAGGRNSTNVTNIAMIRAGYTYGRCAPGS